MRIGDDSVSDGGALSNPENHTFGMPVVGGAGSSLPRRAGVRARTLETSTRHSPVTFVSNNNNNHNGEVAAARTRSTTSSASSTAASQRALALARARAGLRTARSFASEQGGLPPSILMRSARSDGSTQAPPPSAGMPIPQPQSQPQPDVSTAVASLVTMPPTIAGETTDSGGRTPRSLGGMEHYAPPHVRGTFMPR
jgi:hypothetical protein